jgi:hypothetical protein
MAAPEYLPALTEAVARIIAEPNPQEFMNLPTPTDFLDENQSWIDCHEQNAT